MGQYCRRCNKSKFGSCGLGYSKSDRQIRDEKFGCFNEQILRSYDVSETSEEILATKGPYGDPFKPEEIKKTIINLQRRACVTV